MFNRRNFIRSIGVGIAAAMLPFAKLPKLSAPKKAKEYTVCSYWFQATPWAKCYNDEYKEYLKTIIQRPENQARIKTEVDELCAKHPFIISPFIDA